MKNSIITVRSFCFILLLVFNPALLPGQIMRDMQSRQLVNKFAGHIYNLEYSLAGEELEQIKKLYPEHPATYLLNAIVTYWKNFPLIASSPERYSFESDLREAIERCENINGEDEAEILLINLSSRGMLLLFYSDNNLSWEVMPLAAGTYKYLRRAFDYKDSYADFLYFTGLYNYYREAYPEAHPIYKSFVFVFPKGDKKLGLSELEMAADSSLFLKAEASSFLAYIYQNYEKSMSRASGFTRDLHDEFPSNPYYLMLHIKNLLLMGKLDEAETRIMHGYSGIPQEFTKACLTILEGILREKKYRDYEAAEDLYNKGLELMKPFGEFGSDFMSYAYYGLSRINGYKGDQKQQREYRRNANQLTDFRDVNFDNVRK